MEKKFEKNRGGTCNKGQCDETAKMASSVSDLHPERDKCARARHDGRHCNIKKRGKYATTKKCKDAKQKKITK